jgi:hypothetical protein
VFRLTKLIALLMAALWLPATLHCQIEGLGLDTFFACATESDEAAHAGTSDCTDDGCQVVESGQIALAKSRLDLNLQPALACACHLCLLQIAPPALAPEMVAEHQEEALPRQRTWQFARATPARGSMGFLQP